MDTTAVSLCRDNNMPMMVFSMREEGNITRVVSGRALGTLVTPLSPATHLNRSPDRNLSG